MKMKSFVIVVVAVCVSAFISCCQKESQLVSWDVYRGQIEEYEVEIEDSNYEYPSHAERIVDLHPLPVNYIWQGNTAIYLGITGHDYNADGKWDRVFYCGYPEKTNGCNSVTLDAKGRITAWEPCAADNNQVKPFTQKEVEIAIAWLDKAMRSIHKPEYRIKR